jgi:hypothetical protein
MRCGALCILHQSHCYNSQKHQSSSHIPSHNSIASSLHHLCSSFTLFLLPDSTKTQSFKIKIKNLNTQNKPLKTLSSSSSPLEALDLGRCCGRVCESIMYMKGKLQQQQQQQQLMDCGTKLWEVIRL